MTGWLFAVIVTVGVTAGLFWLVVILRSVRENPSPQRKLDDVSMSARRPIVLDDGPSRLERLRAIERKEIR
jgi:hypothetical protein